MISDNELAQQALSNGAAFEELILRHRRQVYGTAYRMVQNHETAEEIAQESFLRAFRSLHSFRRKAKFSTWLYRITMNLCIDHLNRNHSPLNVEELGDIAADFHSPAEHLAHKERQQWLEREIQMLPPKQKSILVLRIFQEMPFKDIANVVGCSTNAAKVNYRHALVRLKERFNNSREDL